MVMNDGRDKDGDDKDGESFLIKMVMMMMKISPIAVLRRHMKMMMKM